MELTEEQERETKAIMAEMSCDNGFKCHKSRFEDLCPVRRFFGADLVECQAENGQDCPRSYAFAGDMLLCKCQLRKYAICKLGR